MKSGHACSGRSMSKPNINGENNSYSNCKSCGRSLGHWWMYHGGISTPRGEVCSPGCKKTIMRHVNQQSRGHAPR